MLYAAGTQIMAQISNLYDTHSLHVCRSRIFFFSNHVANCVFHTHTHIHFSPHGTLNFVFNVFPSNIFQQILTLHNFVFLWNCVKAAKEKWYDDIFIYSKCPISFTLLPGLVDCLWSLGWFHTKKKMIFNIPCHCRRKTTETQWSHKICCKQHIFSIHTFQIARIFNNNNIQTLWTRWLLFFQLSSYTFYYHAEM